MKLKCFHCNEPVPSGTSWHVTINGIDQPMCCIGCQSIASAIVKAGAASYYEQRTTPGLDAQTLESLAPWADLLDDPQWAAQHVRTETSDQQPAAQTTLAIEGLRCGACAWLIEKILATSPGVIEARANASTARLLIRWQPGVTTLPTIAHRIASIGYALLPIGSAPLEAAQRINKRIMLRRLFIAGLASAQIMMYAYPEYLEGASLEGDIRSLMRTASMLITLPVMLYSATPFFESAWRMLRQGRLGMDVPVSLGLLIAFIASMINWWTNSGEVYFDSVSMFVFLLLGARWIESGIRARASEQREKLAMTPPTLADRIAPDPAKVAAWNLRIGDRVRVGSGERVPADGILRSAATEIDNSWLTGESLPLSMRMGDRVTEGAINLGPTIEVAIDTAVSQGTLSRLSQLAQAAATDRPQWVAWADRIGARFTAGILLITAGLIGLAVLTQQPAQVWVASVIAVLVVTCPCALSMAGPAAYSAALAKLLKNGVAVSSSATLERTSSVTDIVFDKTGTLTNPDQSAVRMVFGETLLWPLIYSVAIQSRHPLSHAIAQSAARNCGALNLELPANQAIESQQHAGLGIQATIGNQSIRLGSQRFADPTHHQSLSAEIEKSCTVFLSIDGVIRCGFEINDTARSEASGLIKDLKASGKTIWLMSGDQPERVEKIAATLGIDSQHTRALCTPQAKREAVQEIQNSGGIVLMVGDGHNDAPVLAQADVSIAVHGAAPLATQKADIYLLRDGLSGVLETMHSARSARTILHQNLLWAVLYNLVAIPFAAAGLISPLVASIGMAASSTLVVLNSARLLRN